MASHQVEVNGARLHHEMRGSGPSVLFIPGSTGDAGHFDRVAAALANTFAVVTYDRRGNSRSPRPPDWTATSVAEQADDAAALITALSLAPAAVFGTSLGAVIGLELVLRHPHLVRGMILHEPALLTVLTRPADWQARLRAAVQQGMSAGGPRGGVEAFFRLVAGDAAFDAIEPAVRERMLNNGELVFAVEGHLAPSYAPDEVALASIQRPVQVMAGTESPEPLREAAAWLAAHLGTEVVTLPGGHTPYFDQPQAMAKALRPFLERVSSR